jgi:hypothetical protein
VALRKRYSTDLDALWSSVLKDLKEVPIADFAEQLMDCMVKFVSDRPDTSCFSRLRSTTDGMPRHAVIFDRSSARRFCRRIALFHRKRLYSPRM